MSDIESTKQTRRLQLTGGSTYTLSIPKNWIDDLELKIGDNITLIKNLNKTLTILPKLQDDDPSTSCIISISNKDTDEAIRRKIIAIYLSGFKTIKIKAKGMEILPNPVKIIRELVRSSLIGTEIIESNQNSLTFQVLTQLPQLSFDVALKRMYLMAISIHREAMDAFAKADSKLAEDVIRMDDEVDRFSLYMMRSLNLASQDGRVLLEVGLKKPSDCLGYRTVIKCIERIADHGVLIAKRIKFLESPMKGNLLKSITQLSEKSIEAFNNSITSLTKKDFFLAEKIAEQISNVIENEKQLMDSLHESSKNSTVIKFILEDIRRTAEYSRDIAEVVMDENIQNVISEA